MDPQLLDLTGQEEKTPETCPLTSTRALLKETHALPTHTHTDWSHMVGYRQPFLVWQFGCKMSPQAMCVWTVVPSW